VQQGTWIAVLMDPDPSTSHVLVADDSDGAMATYMNQFVGALTGPAGTPTLAISQRVIESSSPLLIPGVPFDEFISILSPAGQDYFVRHPPPVAMPAVGLLVVPMRVGGATIGTLGRFDWRQQPPLTEADRKSTRLNSSHVAISYAVFCLTRPPPRSTLFPYTTLFRSGCAIRRVHFHPVAGRPGLLRAPPASGRDACRRTPCRPDARGRRDDRDTRKIRLASATPLDRG